MHVDAAASQIVWHVSVASAIPDWASTSAPSLAVMGGKVFVKFGRADLSDALFSVDIATQSVNSPVTIESNPGPIALMTDGTGLYVFDAGKEILYEIDPATAATKRRLELGVPASNDQTFIDNPLVAAGAIWLGRNCGGKIYNRRVDIESWTIADFEFKQAQGQAPQGYAYLAP